MRALVVVTLVLSVLCLFTVTGLYATEGWTRLSVRYILSDDAFYYLRLGERLGTTGASTFDGFHSTNGYHPLWVWALAGLSRLGLTDVAFVVAGVTLSISLYALGLFALLQAGRLRERPFWLAVLPVALIAGAPSMFFLVVNGVETSLAFALLAAFFWAMRALADSGDEPIPRRAVAIAGVVGALLVLARLDYAIIVLCMPLVLWSRWIGQPQQRPRLALLVPAVVAGLVVAVYMAWSRLVFGTAMPVSGLVKRQPPLSVLLTGEFDSLGDAVGSLFWPAGLLVWVSGVRGLALATVVVGTATVALARFPARARSYHAAATLAGWLHTAGYLAFQGAGLAYYFVPLVVSCAWAFGVLAERLAGRLGTVARLAPAVCLFAATLWCATGVVAAAPLLYHTHPERAWRWHRLEATRWVDDALPPEARIGTWWAGAFGYFAPRSVINLDGVVNDMTYLAALRSCTLVPYADREGIRYFADYFPADPLDASAWSHRVFERRCWTEIWSALQQSGRALEVVRHWPDPGSRQPGAGYYVLRIAARSSGAAETEQTVH